MPHDKTNSGTPHLSTDELLNDYLSDMFSGTPAPAAKTDTVVDEVTTEATPLADNPASVRAGKSQYKTEPCTSEQTSALSQLDTQQSKSFVDILGGGCVSTVEAISPDLSLIPTIKLIRNVEDKGYRTQTEAQIILLIFLFYLRKPLSPRVRQSFLDYSEQAIDDYYAAAWLTNVASECPQ